MERLPDTIDQRTMAAYAAHAQSYARLMEERCEAGQDLPIFVRALPEGHEPVLDWGSGVGQTAALLAGLGISGDATDASPEMAAIAATLGVRTRVEPFEALDADQRYRGIWATASLCHVRYAHMPAILKLAYRALIPKGVLHIAVKHGEGEERDSLGRLFCLWTPEALSQAVSAAGFDVKIAVTTQGPSLTDGHALYTIVAAKRPPAA